MTISTSHCIHGLDPAWCCLCKELKGEMSEKEERIYKYFNPKKTGYMKTVPVKLNFVPQYGP